MRCEAGPGQGRDGGGVGGKFHTVNGVYFSAEKVQFCLTPLFLTDLYVLWPAHTDEPITFTARSARGGRVELCRAPPQTVTWYLLYKSIFLSDKKHGGLSFLCSSSSFES